MRLGGLKKPRDRITDTYTPLTVWVTCTKFRSRIPQPSRARSRGPLISPGLRRERILLIAAAVYGNRYCVALHWEQLRSLGMTDH